LNTLINTDDNLDEDSDGLDENAARFRTADSFEIDELEAKLYINDDEPGLRTFRMHAVPEIHTAKSKIYDSLVDINIDWNNFQELKLILYSIDFLGGERLRYDQLERRTVRLIQSFLGL
jgi:hypothetical protein